jgi:hypothetical protein
LLSRGNAVSISGGSRAIWKLRPRCNVSEE